MCARIVDDLAFNFLDVFAIGVPMPYAKIPKDRRPQVKDIIFAI